MDLFSNIETSDSEVEAIVRGLYTVAVVDGLHDREVQLIADLFHGRLGGLAPDDGIETPASLARFAPIDPRALATLLVGPAHRELFLRAAYMLAWADGQVSFAERASIDAFAAALEVEADALARCEASVKEHLLLNAATSALPAGVSFA